MPQIILLSHSLSEETPLYGGEQSISIKSKTSITKGDSANTLTLNFPNHTGTHLDVPRHFFNDGNTLSDYPPEFWIFNKPQLVDIPCDENYLITPNDFNNSLIANTDLLLIRTGFEQYRFQEKYWKYNPGLSSTFAHWVREEHPNVRAVGIDTISITSYQNRDDGRNAHQGFLGKNDNSDPVMLIEDVSLIPITGNINQVIISPLFIENGDGAPCTIFGML